MITPTLIKPSTHFDPPIKTYYYRFIEDLVNPCRQQTNLALPLRGDLRTLLGLELRLLLGGES